jgi:hypothetical protein
VEIKGTFPLHLKGAHMPVITRKALIQRINRDYRKKDEHYLFRTTPKRSIRNLGYYFIVDTSDGSLAAWHSWPEKEAQELGLLRLGEEVDPNS